MKYFKEIEESLALVIDKYNEKRKFQEELECIITTYKLRPDELETNKGNFFLVNLVLDILPTLHKNIESAMKLNEDYLNEIYVECIYEAPSNYDYRVLPLACNVIMHLLKRIPGIKDVRFRNKTFHIDFYR